MTKCVLTFGELMMRLKTPGLERFGQADSFDMTFGGAEANVAVSLALLGLDSVFVTGLPKNPFGNRAEQELKRWGVNTENVLWRDDGRLGLYFMEFGANQRSGQVVYDRAHSIFSHLKPGDINWSQVFEGADWFHISGISPAISQSAADVSLEAVKAAKEAGVTVSVDLNYRGRLWNYGKRPEEIMPAIVRNADVLIAGRGDCQQSLDIYGEGDPDSREYFEILTQKMMAKFDNLSSIAVTIRDTQSAEHHKWTACLRVENGILFSGNYEIRDVVDRVGSGDAFSAGLIYGFCENMSAAETLEFGAAANCLKHSIVGDFNLVTVDEVLALRDGDGTGRVKR